MSNRTPDSPADGPLRDERPCVFDPGYTTSERGTGFGLAIVHRVADAHGWRVVVTESDTGGARFECHDVAFVDDTVGE